MLGLGAIEIEEATYNIGMCGHIVVRINETGQRYRLMMSMHEGIKLYQVAVRLKENDRPLRLSFAEFIEQYLPRGRWTQETFIVVWAGYAAGYEQGKHDGTHAERENHENL